MTVQTARETDSFTHTTVSSYQASYELSESLMCRGMHYHEDYEILVHGRNGDVMYIGCQAYDMQPRDLYVIPPYQVHSRARPVVVNDYERMYLYVTPEVLRSVKQQVLPVKRIIDDSVRQHGYKFQLTVEEFENIRALVRSIRNCGEQDSPYDRWEDLIRMESFLCAVCRAMARQSGDRPPNAASHMPMMDVLAYINTHFTEDLTLDRISEKFSISKSYLAHEFSKCFNMSIYQYVLMNRIIYARQLILEGEPMLSVALRCGFNDYSNFLRAFTRHTGDSPSAWKKNRVTSAVERG